MLNSHLFCGQNIDHRNDTGSLSPIGRLKILDAKSPAELQRYRVESSSGAPGQDHEGSHDLRVWYQVF